MNQIKVFIIYLINYFKKKIYIFFNERSLLQKFYSFDKIILLSGNNIGDIYLGLDVASSDITKKTVILCQDYSKFISPLIAKKIQNNHNVIFSSKLFYLILFSKKIKKKLNKLYLLQNNINYISLIRKKIKLNTLKKTLIYRSINNSEFNYINKLIKINQKKIIFFSSRDSFYKNDSELNSFRNSNLKKSFSALKYLNKKKYQTIRIGHYKFINKKFFTQYTEKNTYKRNLIENYVGSRCSFAIVSTSGILSLPTFYNKPVLVHNFIGFNKPPLMKRAIIIPKILKYKDGSVVPINELFKKNYFKFEYDNIEDKIFPLTRVNIGGFQSDAMYKKAKIIFEENTEDEILNGVIEMEKYFIQKRPINSFHKKLDLKFKRLFPPDYWLNTKDILFSFYWLKKNFHLYEADN